MDEYTEMMQQAEAERTELIDKMVARVAIGGYATDIMQGDRPGMDETDLEVLIEGLCERIAKMQR